MLRQGREPGVPQMKLIPAPDRFNGGVANLIQLRVLTQIVRLAAEFSEFSREKELYPPLIDETCKLFVLSL